MQNNEQNARIVLQKYQTNIIKGKLSDNMKLSPALSLLYYNVKLFSFNEKLLECGTRVINKIETSL